MRKEPRAGRQLKSQVRTANLMKTEFSDTPDHIEEIRARMLRERGLAFRVSRGLALSDEARRIAFSALRRLHPKTAEIELDILYCEVAYGSAVAELIRKKISCHAP